jgi:hypothetical protein
VRWYLRFGLSYRDVEQLLAERAIDVDHAGILRWMQRFMPLLTQVVGDTTAGHATQNDEDCPTYTIISRRHDGVGPAGVTVTVTRNRRRWRWPLAAR